jgi:LmbE family N-acetylglucosaminyl deacetylase
VWWVHDVRSLGTIVGVWAHPDDEAYLSAGLMAAAVDAGSRVVCITATRGEHGTSDARAWPPTHLAVTRTQELEASLAALGVQEHHWLGYADGACASAHEPTAIESVRSIIETANAETVVTFGPDGMTGHPDHIAVGRWATVAAAQASSHPRVLHATKTADWADHFAYLHERVAAFGPEGPPRTDESDLAFAITLSSSQLDQKMTALRAQATQTAAVIELVGEDSYRNWVAREYFVDARRPSAHTADTDVPARS